MGGKDHLVKPFPLAADSADQSTIRHAPHPCDGRSGPDFNPMAGKVGRQSADIFDRSALNGEPGMMFPNPHQPMVLEKPDQRFGWEVKHAGRGG